jgi:sugar phosphate isomerase/epimerase
MIEMEPTKTGEAGRLGFRLSGFRLWPVTQALQVLSEIGYRSVELCLEHPELDPLTLTKAKIAEIKQCLDHTGLRVSAVSYHGKRDELSATLSKQKAGLELAREFGTGVLVAGTGLRASDPQGISTHKALEELIRAAEEIGCIVAVEPEPDTVIHGMAEFSLLVSRLAGTPVGLNFDVGHAALTENDVGQTINEWGAFIRHVHLEDLRKPHHVHLLPGDGELELPRLVGKLRQNGYAGDLTVDLFDILDAPDVWARRAMTRCCELNL